MTPTGLRIATVGGVPVYIGRSWPVIALVVVVTFGPQVQPAIPGLATGTAYLVALAYALLLLVSVLAHEAAHAVVATRAGYHVQRVVADLWGGHTAYETQSSRPGPSALVALAGPAANAALAAFGWLLLPFVSGDIGALLMGAAVWTNGFVAAFNLLPGLPLDGGFLLEAAVWRLTGSRQRGLLVAGWCGRVVAVLAVAWVLARPLLRGEQPSLFQVVWGGLIGAFLWTGASGAIRAGAAGTALDRIPLASVLHPVVALPAGATVADADTALSRPHGGLARVVTGVVVDGTGRPVALVDPAALAGVPAHLRATTPIVAAVRGQPDGWVLDLDPAGSALSVVTRMQQLGHGTVLVRTPGQALAGVVYAADLDARLSA
ncbi:MAG TPA: site-2 protease family protein [Dermatophilaceae bacterium]|nr:site-2 protease family protein [Dermatophilaceae bacterium]